MMDLKTYLESPEVKQSAALFESLPADVRGALLAAALTRALRLFRQLAPSGRGIARAAGKRRPAGPARREWWVK